MSPPRGAEPGFTLLEVLVVLVVLGLALAVAVPRGGRRAGEPEATARALAAELERARGRAIDAARVEPVDPAALARLLPAGLGLAQDGPAPLRFFPDGSASGAVLRLDADGRRASLVVEAPTGRIGRLGG